MAWLVIEASLRRCKPDQVQRVCLSPGETFRSRQGTPASLSGRLWTAEPSLVRAKGIGKTWWAAGSVGRWAATDAFRDFPRGCGNKFAKILCLGGGQAGGGAG